ncbi:hypothetical protein D0Z00_001848 [Geotrichum galactomycetum]|uniref:Uncharacterized protein n=1 Tax=Geotrichum galactomycetum TaxID=27317 RepID=A0ACB6V5V3_9ASCO|nr:hypothetical protein D0Z00_001848 [Geotrichum candidum]
MQQSVHQPQKNPQQGSQQVNQLQNLDIHLEGPQQGPQQGPQGPQQGLQQHAQKESIQGTQQASFQCEWKNCNFSCDKMDLFMAHVREAHVQGMVGNMVIPTAPPLTSATWSKTVSTDSPPDIEIHMCLWEHESVDATTALPTLCQQTFNSTQALNQHVIESHIGLRKNNYVCHWQDCDRHKRPFSQRQKIHRHLITHTKHKPFTCEVCHNSFSEAVVLKQHMRVHSGEKPFPCKVCGKRFAASTAVSVHMRTHTGEKPLKCRFEGCDKRFSESSNLAKHMKTHLVEKKYACTEPNCTKRFVRNDQLQRHLKTHENRLMREKLKQNTTATLLTTNQES